MLEDIYSFLSKQYGISHAEASRLTIDEVHGLILLIPVIRDRYNTHVASSHASFYWSIDIPNRLESWDAQLAWIYEPFVVIA